MNNKKLAGWAASSNNQEDVSNRIKGLVIAFSGVIIFVASQFFGISLTANDVVELATQLSVIGGLAFSLYGGILALIRKFATVK